MRIKYLVLTVSIVVASCVQKTKQEHNPELSPAILERLALIKDTSAREKYSELRYGKNVSNDYKVICERLVQLSNEYPDERFIGTTQAAVCGDYGQSLSAEEEKAYKADAVKKLEIYTKQEFEHPYGIERLIVFNEYYYHSGQFLKQYELGNEFLQNSDLGHANKGIGASEHALELYNKKKFKESKVYAKKSLEGFEHPGYLKNQKKRDDLQGDPFYIVALALSGNCTKAQNNFDAHIKTDIVMYKQFHRWYELRNPENLSVCKKKK